MHEGRFPNPRNRWVTVSLRWSEEEFRRYEQRTAVALVPHAIVQAVGRDIPREKRARMNRTEALYALELEAKRQAGELLEWGFEDTKLRLGNGTYFKPDFRVVMVNGETEFHEIKGFWREAARVRIKVAADRFPRYRFVALTRRRKREGGGWNVEEF